MNAAVSSCFHCGLPVPARANYSIRWDDMPRALCCAGCEAVAHAIVDAGLDDYYRRRRANAPAPQILVPDTLRQLAVYDHPSVQRSFVRDAGAHREATLILEGITCAACVWLNEQHLQRLPGVHSVEVNYSTRRARIVWDDRRLHLSDILAAVMAIGYRAYPYDPARQQQVLASERRTLLRRLGVAAIFNAQVMTLSEALYVGDWAGSDPGLRTFFSWVSLVLTLPVLLYAAQPFFRAALNDLRHRRMGMDVPIAVSIAAAFVASAAATASGNGTIYYDAVTMFVFLLLAARYFEQAARARAAHAVETLVQATPAIATRLCAGGEPEQVAVAELGRGDRVLIRPGENIPADGTVLEGRSSVNESLLTGESLPLGKKPGDSVIGGSINIESPLTVRVVNVGQGTVLSAMLRLLDRASAEKPRLAQMADRVAAWFVAAVIALAIGVGLYWWMYDPARALPIAIAVLIVTCPCALGLATPAALSAATGALTRRGLLVTRGHALETLARATHFVFDKTGTLTTGMLRLSRVEVLADVPRDRCLALAAALERHSEHPVARALVVAARDIPAAHDIANYPGEGITGKVAHESLVLGTPAFVASRGGLAADGALLARLRANGGTVVILATSARLLAVFVLADSVRPEAAETITELKRLGAKTAILTGDHAAAAIRMARELGIDTVRAGLKPHDKLAHVEALQRRGAIVAMVGDGINDAPVLAGASVSVAVNGAAHVAASSADMILLSHDLRVLVTGVRTARRTQTIVRQNLIWAVVYNVLAVPAAAMGIVTPWMAALGMSASSLFVVLNALRLTRSSRRTPPLSDTAQHAAPPTLLAASE